MSLRAIYFPTVIYGDPVPLNAMVSIIITVHFAFWMSLKVVMAVFPLNNIFFGTPCTCGFYNKHKENKLSLHFVKKIYYLVYVLSAALHGHQLPLGLGEGADQARQLARDAQRVANGQAYHAGVRPRDVVLDTQLSVAVVLIT